MWRGWELEEEREKEIEREKREESKSTHIKVHGKNRRGKWAKY